MEVLRRSTKWLEGKGVTNARRECEWLFCRRLGCSRLDLYTRFDMPLDDAALDLLREDLRRRGRREPLAYILGNQPFAGVDLTVTPAVLVPRPETERLVELALAGIEGRDAPRVLDVGTGSGAIALAIKQALPGATVAATELSAEALAVAMANAERLGLEVAFHHGDLLAGLEGSWDLVVANLPYVAEEERELMDPETGHEPVGALFAPEGGMALVRRLLENLPPVLAPEGCAWLEIGFRQGERTREAAAAAGLGCAIVPDDAGRDRYARVRGTA